MRRLLLRVASTWALALAMGPMGFTESAIDVQSRGVGPCSDGRIAGGLGFLVNLEGGPHLYKYDVAYDGVYGQRSGESRERSPLDFGAIIAGTPSGAASAFEQDWAHVGIAISPSLRLLVSRLTPALVLDVSAPEFAVFAGEKAPHPTGFATSEGVFPADRLADLTLNTAEGAWLLAWFGREAGFRSTRFPWSYTGAYGHESPAASVDCPVLFVFQHPPESARLGDDGLTFSFGGAQPHAGLVAMLPLFGDLYPPVQETEAWRDHLPGDVGAQCDWWAEHLAEIPLTARETYSYDEPTDTLTIAERVRYLRVRDGGTEFAPLSPMLALAREQGLAMELSGRVESTGLLTAVGPYVGIEHASEYSCRLSGLGKYVREERVVGGVAREPSELARQLSDQISRMTEAGHLAPWYAATNTFSAGYTVYFMNMGNPTWSNSGEMLRILSEALPLLDREQAQAVRGYMQTERNTYPPEKIAVLPMEVGSRRERWRFDRDLIPVAYDQERTVFEQMNDRIADGANVYVRNHLIPPAVVYDTAEHARATGSPIGAEEWAELQKILEPYALRQDWATLGWYAWPGSDLLSDRYGLGGEVDVNRHFAALVGALRLARQVGDTESQPALWGQFARAAVLRYAMGHYGDYLYSHRFMVLPTDSSLTRQEWETYCGSSAIDLWREPDWMVKYFSGSWTGRLYTYSWTEPENDVRTILVLSERGVKFDELFSYYNGIALVRYYNLTPELARFVADHEKEKARIYLDRVAENLPDWYLALSTASFGAERSYNPPEDPYFCFLARAWVLGETPKTLSGYLDVPWMQRGDLYYIHKLVETIYAYRGVTWRKR